MITTTRYRSRRSPLAWATDHFLPVAIALGVILLLGIPIGASIMSAHHVVQHHDCVVSTPPQGVARDDNVERRVYTENCGTFVVEDRFFAGYFSSGDTWGEIVGKTGTFDFTTVGYRIPFFSSFPSITEVEQVG